MSRLSSQRFCCPHSCPGRAYAIQTSRGAAANHHHARHDHQSRRLFSRPNATVVIEGPRIIAVSAGAAPAVTLAKNARILDGSGRYLIRASGTMHVHAAFGDWFPGGRDIILPLFIANGVTGVRDMGGDVRCCSLGANRLPLETSLAHA
jgi:hypothetical protein